MDRRAFLTSMTAAAAAGACTSPDAGAEGAGRPTLAIESDGPGRWRIRSWQWRDDAWRPAIAQAKLAGRDIEINGPIDAADRREVIARLKA